MNCEHILRYVIGNVLVIDAVPSALVYPFKRALLCEILQYDFSSVISCAYKNKTRLITLVCPGTWLHAVTSCFRDLFAFRLHAHTLSCFDRV